MKKDISCSIVHDLLPNYIERLTSDESNAEIERHLNECHECQEVYTQMTAEVVPERIIPTAELKFFKKIKRTRLIAAALCLILTFGLSWLVYTSEFKYTGDKINLSAAITEYAAPFRNPVDAYVLETEEMAGTLIVTFKDRERPEVNGVALFTKGINQKYRIIQASFKTSGYSAVVQIFREKIHDEQYYVVSGYNLSDTIDKYGISYSAYKNPGYLSTDRVSQVLRFEVENSQFLKLFKMEELDSQAAQMSDELLFNYHLSSSLLYDSAGVDITEDFVIRDQSQNEVNHSIGTAETGMIYALIVVIMIIGMVMIRYFITE